MSTSAQSDPDHSSNRPDDYALMERIQNRDESALRSLFDTYRAIVYGVCLRALRDTGESEDLLVDIFFEIWDRADRYDASRGSPIGHLMGLTRSRIIDRLRSRRSRARVGGTDATAAEFAATLPVDTPGPADSAQLSEQCHRVTGALTRLPPEQRQVLELTYFDAMSHAEIAAQLHQPLGTIKSRIRQALIRLRNSMERGGQ